ncbi:MAG: hypothetical protein ACI81V_001010 [Lentimonas sp.]|jgi:hypothetical protein
MNPLSSRRCFTLLFAALLCSNLLPAGPSHGDSDHAHAGLTAPNGGRLVQTVEPHLEFLLLPDRFVQISFVNDAGELVAAAEQSIRLVGGDRSHAIRVGFERVGTVLRSTQAMPDLADMPIILQIKTDPSAGTVLEKFYLNTFTCGGCDLAEYACTCGH